MSKMAKFSFKVFTYGCGQTRVPSSVCHRWDGKIIKTDSVLKADERLPSGDGWGARLEPLDDDSALALRDYLDSL